MIQRRKIISSLLLASLSFTAGAVSAVTCLGGKNLIFNNGHILTMDTAGTVAKALRIRDEKVTAIDQLGDVGDPCVTVIDLGYNSKSNACRSCTNLMRHCRSIRCICSRAISVLPSPIPRAGGFSRTIMSAWMKKAAS